MNDTTPPAHAAPAGESPANSEAVTPVGRKKGAARIVTPVLAGIAAIAIGLFGGILIGHNTVSSTSQASGVRGGFGGGAPGAAGGGLTAGTISSIDGDTITLTLTDGSKVTVTTGASTAVTMTADGKVSDLATGDTIAVRGTTDSSGDVTATSVSEGALTGGFGGGTPPTGTGK